MENFLIKCYTLENFNETLYKAKMNLNASQLDDCLADRICEVAGKIILDTD